MTEPKVEFDLNNIQTQNVELLKILDDIRRWYEYREDRNTPAMQTFEGEVTSSGNTIENFRKVHYLPGNVYGAVGYMKQFNNAANFNPGAEWKLMGTSASVYGAYFFTPIEGEKTVEVRGGYAGAGFDDAVSQYRITVFYRGNPDAN